MKDQNIINVENTQAQMRKGILEFCILLVISKDRIYANELINELKSAGLIVVEGTIYPLLSRLKNSGLLDYEWEESLSGPPRKYYKLTDKGRAVLRELKSTWERMDKSINLLLSNFK